jgi:hypothetical protein
MDLDLDLDLDLDPDPKPYYLSKIQQSFRKKLNIYII